MGAGGDVNAFFGIATTIIAVPTGVKVFNWLFTMYRGKITLDAPMLWVTAFFTTFAIGGMTGVLMAIPPVDFHTHNSLFNVAHFHNVIIGGVLFGYFAGFNFWFPKALGFKLNARLNKWAFGFWVVGFYVAFMPIYVLGLMGVMRRMQHYDVMAYQPYFIIAAIGAAIIFLGIVCQLLQIGLSLINYKKLRDKTGDPWNGRTLEWATSSPAPFYNFAKIPTVDSLDQHWEDKQNKKDPSTVNPENETYEPIHMPKDTATGFIAAIFSGVFGFAMIWHMWLPAIVGFVGMLATVIARTFSTDVDYYVDVETVKATELKHFKEMHS